MSSASRVFTPVPSGPVWTCPSCQTGDQTSPFCRVCGERRLTDRDRTVGGLFGQWFESLFHVDGRILRTCLRLVDSPGELTAAYLAGRRKPFVGPIQLFLAVNLVFFVVQTVSGLAILFTPLSVHLHGMDYSAIAQRLVEAHLAGRQTTLAAYAPLFDRREDTIAKSLVVVMAPMLALLAALLFVRQRRAAPTHLVFALHFYAFMLLFLTLLFPVAALVLLGLTQLGVHVSARVLDDVASTIELVAIIQYFARAVPKVYGVPLAYTVFAVTLLSASVPFILYAYRFITLCVTLYTT
jgi:hypothetical protein